MHHPRRQVNGTQLTFSSAMPEPATAALAALGLAGLGALRHRRARAIRKTTKQNGQARKPGRFALICRGAAQTPMAFLTSRMKGFTSFRLHT
ncbi:PEP-CTERM sorting domain-containing protein [Zoogloea sp. 1C4]|uniref:PEP-CTERM sorting domain-containing protein n=2 Tax=Zoogloea TaxID=349 RepID=UPI001290D7BC|nr:PEP-CTERM sorting domain-containing protein [Zoogloea sp. 1C4]